MGTSDGDDGQHLHELELEIEEEVAEAVASHPEEVAGLPVTDWLFDPTDVEREEISLRGLLDAVQVLEEYEEHPPPDGPGT
ncbi:hypothetical protein SAMN05421678_11743 [Actinopolymorpha cephalotaxi]|uniref:Uncharacterized protein n=1 Tax=Actinopolymorpha cephalotaxi TaxID=504797 RepID=A0A1I2ZT96_9ACTN|nr:hypothetical protein [Actinopolymorpha cephalotaxi]NYH84143.1 hypothetical protein [Actinopolymorpha cephalotaxi]SFH40729.1 hypothetical protein SAMN05421678_11743 [Actinopolymorpha cephalotaxi]